MNISQDGGKIKHFFESDIGTFLTEFPADIHKGDRGGVLILGGSWHYRGAPLLAALAALRTGAGLAVLAIPDYIVDAASIMLPEAVFLPLKTMDANIVEENLFDVLEPWLKRVGALVIGPGIGRDKELKAIIERFWSHYDMPMLIDADALYFVAQAWDEMPYRENIIITPHSGEAGRILNKTASEINNDRYANVIQLSQRVGTALLKGKNTMISSCGETRVVDQGSPALAVPGSGDVLSGCIGALLARGLSPFDAATCGVLVHAVAGESLGQSVGVSGILAREIADALPSVIRL